MSYINENFLNMQDSYLFSTIAKKVAKYTEENPDKKIIKLGIGDVTKPIVPACIEAMHRATDELSHLASFHGYGPEQGYDFLIEAIIRNDFEPRGIKLSNHEVFINDGAKSDTGNIGDIFNKDNRIAVTDPVYPVYVDSNVMAGRAGILNKNGCWSDITYLPCTEENNFVPSLPSEQVDIIYLCYPNNPTGTTLTKAELKKWVDYAIANNSIIFFDAAYEAFIREDDVPHSIYEIEGARKCAIEFRSFSKTAGFTGVRCGYTIIPDEVTAKDCNGEDIQLNKLWLRRQCTKFNGTSYVTQRAAEAIYSEDGKEQVKANIDYYMENARIMREGLQKVGMNVYGGCNSPYLWLKTPAGYSSWQFFDKLLNDANVVGTPGVGFGPSGEGFLRLTAFGRRDDCIEAMHRIEKYI